MFCSCNLCGGLIMSVDNIATDEFPHNEHLESIDQENERNLAIEDRIDELKKEFFFERLITIGKSVINLDSIIERLNEKANTKAMRSAFFSSIFNIENKMFHELASGALHDLICEAMEREHE